MWMSNIKTLNFRRNNVVNGRLISVQSKQKCYYQYIIHESDSPNWMPNSNRIESGFTYTSALGAFSAGKAAALKLSSKTKL